MARHSRRRRNRRRAYYIVTTCGVAMLLGWWLWPDAERERPEKVLLANGGRPALTSDRPQPAADPIPSPAVTEKGERPAEPAEPPTKPPEVRTEQLLAAGKQALEHKDWIVAREYLSEALERCDNKREQVELRADLVRIAQETIFSARTVEGDPLVDRYTVKAGDTLGKIAKQYRISDDFIASINGLRNKNIIRIGQGLKVVRGPFHAVVNSAGFTMDLYLGEGDERTLVKHFRVGLGEDGSTPRGKWKVKNKLKNPTYYPPRGGKIIAADDPNNPLGERWIGLEGIGGEALGQLRYGMHGTIEPQSIGKNASLGCIRLYNEDVELLFDCFIVDHSTVEVR
jgi:lipoprotein-anchoring transpeptidase ErfK/SrfK